MSFGSVSLPTMVSKARNATYGIHLHARARAVTRSCFNLITTMLLPKSLQVYLESAKRPYSVSKSSNSNMPRAPNLV